LDQQPKAPDRPDDVKPGGQAAITNGQSPVNGTPPGSVLEPEAPPLAPPLTPMGWLSQNGPYLIFLFAIAALIYVKQGGVDGLIKWTLVIFGVGFVIFIHELGHFATAKWCDVKVTTFSIGFGPALPGCSWQKGETTYKIALLPLGGYVQMVGEGTEGDEQEDDPRSFKNKTVSQRMLIISAGVIMNVILGAVCFVAVYELHGVPQLPAAVDRVDPGSPSWQKGVRTSSLITQIGSIKEPTFQDLKVNVSLTGSNDPSIPFTFIRTVAGKDVTTTIDLQPRRDENNKMPTIGVLQPSGLKLTKKSSSSLRDQPAYNGSAAVAARVLDLQPGDVILKATDSASNAALTNLPPNPAESMAELCRRMRLLVGEPMTLVVRRKGQTEDEKIDVPPHGFEFDDVVVGTTDPATPEETFNVSALARAPAQLVGETKFEVGDPFDLHQRMRVLAGKPAVLEVMRAGGSRPVKILVPPAYHWTVPIRMKMGKVAAIRDDSPAVDKVRPGDVISEAVLTWGNDEPIPFKKIDPVKLPFQLARAVATKPDPSKWKVELTVLRQPADPNEKAGLVSVPITLSWQDEWSSNEEVPLQPASPMSIPQLGIAYLVESTVEEVTDKDVKSIQTGDVIEKIRFRELTKKGDKEDWTPWGDMYSRRDKQRVFDEWAYYFFQYMQQWDHHDMDVLVRRGQELINDPIRLTTTEDTDWPIADRGLHFIAVMKVVRADSLGDALSLGVKDTANTLKQIYVILVRLLTFDVSPKVLGGPIAIGTQAFAAAEDPWMLTLFLGMISVNLAVVNFLPIPVLDGGHMVFLIYEKLRGKPPSEGVRTATTWIGISLLLCLMVFVTFQDIIKGFFTGP
jgi:regulator of sigma E protease